MSKYNPLYDYLVSLDKHEWNTTFKEIENITKFKLPKSAYTYSARWANEATTHSHANSWLKAGWTTNNVNPAGGRVRFVRERQRQSTAP